MKYFLLIFFFCTKGLFANALQKDPIDDIALFIKASNTKEISRYFSSTVELSILADNDVYSKAQAELILKDFFNRYHPKEVKIINRLASNPNYRLGVASFSAGDLKFLAFFSLKNTGGRFLITEIRIETAE